MKIIDVFQPVNRDINGWKSELDEYYDNEEEAQKHCTGMGFKPEVKKWLGLQLEDGKVYLFASSTPIPVFHTTNEMKVAKALDKLTPEEKKLLGH